MGSAKMNTMNYERLLMIGTSCLSGPQLSMGKQEAFEIFVRDHEDHLTIEDNKKLLKQRRVTKRTSCYSLDTRTVLLCEPCHVWYLFVACSMLFSHTSQGKQVTKYMHHLHATTMCPYLFITLTVIPQKNYL